MSKSVDLSPIKLRNSTPVYILLSILISLILPLLVLDNTWVFKLVTPNIFRISNSDFSTVLRYGVVSLSTSLSTD